MVRDVSEGSAASAGVSAVFAGQRVCRDLVVRADGSIQAGGKSEIDVEL